MRRRTLMLLLLALALGFGLLVWPRVQRFLQVDACLDAGGRWNHERAVCEHS